MLHKHWACWEISENVGKQTEHVWNNLKKLGKIYMPPVAAGQLRAPNSAKSRKNTKKHMKIHKILYRSLNRILIGALCFSKCHPGHCACLRWFNRRFNKSNCVPHWPETQTSYPMFGIFDVNKSVMLHVTLLLSTGPNVYPSFLLSPPKSWKIVFTLSI